MYEYNLIDLQKNNTNIKKKRPKCILKMNVILYAIFKTYKNISIVSAISKTFALAKNNQRTYF